MHPPEYSRKMKQILRSKKNSLESKLPPSKVVKTEESFTGPKVTNKRNRKKHCFTIISIHKKLKPKAKLKTKEDCSSAKKNENGKETSKG